MNCIYVIYDMFSFFSENPCETNACPAGTAKCMEANFETKGRYCYDADWKIVPGTLAEDDSCMVGKHGKHGSHTYHKYSLLMHVIKMET